jgi:predicted O-methyltransferase YrrM
MDASPIMLLPWGTMIRDFARVVRGVLTASAAYDPLRIVRRKRALRAWRRKGRPVPAPPDVKQALLIHYGREYGLSSFVETGTFRGGTLAAMRPHFGQLVSIELEPVLASHARRRFRLFRNVKVIEGDSAHELEKIVAALDQPTLFWLDGHDSGAGTALTEPLREELAAVMAAPAGSVVLIDDARTFTGPPRMSLEEIRAATETRYAMELRDDVIRLTPG